MKTIVYFIVSTVVISALIVVASYGMRYVSNISTPVTIVQPKAGVTCATMVTSDGAAISCWKD